MFRSISHLFLLITVASVVTPATHAAAASDAPLDPPYRNLVHPSAGEVNELFQVAVPARSDFESALSQQSPVKSQQRRGVCSIFSATAWMENYLIRQGVPAEQADLSEEWLEYLAARESAQEGSDSTTNYSNLIEWGQANEATLPYIGEDWSAEGAAASGLALERCGSMRGTFQREACLYGHFDPRALTLPEPELQRRHPELHAAKTEGAALRDRYLPRDSRAVIVRTIPQVKTLLRQGRPVTLDIDFYYGAWNHRSAEKHGILRNEDHWARGIVGHPEPGSVDRLRSTEAPAGHSVLVVGYDDEMEIEIPVKMGNGREKTFKYKGVYIIKNSWGTEGFGRDFSYNGVRAPGYGIITQAYAHEFGAFYRLQVKSDK
jgi:hypothetical protein